MLRKMSILGKKALVTGSTSGIGLSIAKQLAEAGCDVIVCGSRSQEAAGTAVGDVRSVSSAKVHYIQCDFKNTDNVLRMCEEADKLFPEGIDILVNNAGCQHVAKIEDQPLEKWNELMTVNLTTPFLLSKHVIPGMKRKGWGRIINVSSVMAIFAHYNKSPYVSSKTGLVGLTRAVALETAEYGITCNAICPAWVDTPLVAPQVQAYAEKVSKPLEEAKHELFTNATPTKKAIQSTQIAALVMFLCSPGADNMTGTTIPVDGGMSVQ